MAIAIKHPKDFQTLPQPDARADAARVAIENVGGRDAEPRNSA